MDGRIISWTTREITVITKRQGHVSENLELSNARRGTAVMTLCSAVHITFCVTTVLADAGRACSFLVYGS